MAQARSAVSAAAATRVQVIAPASLGATAVAALRARGIEAKLARERTDALPTTEDVIAWALDAAPSGARAVELAHMCTRAAELGRPIVLLAPPARGAGRAAIERAAAL